MKKLFMTLFAACLGIMAGCSSAGTNESKEDPAQVQEASPVSKEEAQNVSSKTAEVEPTSADVQQDSAAAPTEPSENEKCSVCNMEVYHEDHEMGMFTGQVVTADGKHLFTDDMGCLMNQIRSLEEKPLAAYARDYNTLEWIPVDQATAVKANIKTPMKMGFALFGTEDAAKKFVDENNSLEPALSTIDEIDKIAEERQKAKMEKMKQSQGKAEGHMNGNMEGHNMDGMDNNMSGMEMDNSMHGNMDGEMKHN